MTMSSTEREDDSGAARDRRVRTSFARSLRIAPLAALVTLTFLAGGVRLERARRKVRRDAGSLAVAPGIPAAPLLTGGAGEEPAQVPRRAGATLHGDAQRTHRAQGRGPKELRLGWSFVAGDAIQAQITASPDEKTLYAASLDANLYALDKATGALKWKVPLGDRIYSTPAVADDGTLYVGSDAGLFFAINDAGRILWKLETQAQADTAPVLASDGTIFFGAGAQLWALYRDGHVRWRFGAKDKIFSSPALSPDGLVVVFGSQDDRLYAVSAAGKLAWSLDLGADVDASSVIAADGSVFAGSDAGEVVRVSPRGEIVWRTKLGGFVRGALSLARNGDVLAGVYGPTPRQVRLDSATGTIKGAFSVQGTGAPEFGVHGGALEDADGALYFGAQDDTVYALDPRGAIRWTYGAGGDVDCPLTLLGDGSLVFGADDGKVQMLLP
jgi:outer membrane protein assembly factor BamB